jgi:hypothetical protein
MSGKPATTGRPAPQETLAEAGNWQHQQTDNWRILPAIAGCQPIGRKQQLDVQLRQGCQKQQGIQLTAEQSAITEKTKTKTNFLLLLVPYSYCSTY